MSGTIAQMQEAARSLEASNIGYDQKERWSFFDRDTKTINVGQESDCSSMCGAIMAIGGYPVDLTGSFFTGNFAEKAAAAGFKVIPFKNLKQLRPGDFVLKPGKHVEFVYSETQMYSSRIDENGKVVGGTDGDQTGRETRFAPYYNYLGGWESIIRPPDSVAPAKPAAPAAPATTDTGGFDVARMPRLDWTANDLAVRTETKRVQALLAANGFNPGPLDGRRGNQSRLALAKAQRAFNSGDGNGNPDWIIGEKTWEKLLLG